MLFLIAFLLSVRVTQRRENKEYKNNEEQNFDQDMVTKHERKREERIII